MLQAVGADTNGFKGLLGQRRIPHQVLGAVDFAPEPVGVHDDADKLGVVDMRRGTVDLGAGLDALGRRSGHAMGGC